MHARALRRCETRPAATWHAPALTRAGPAGASRLPPSLNPIRVVWRGVGSGHPYGEAWWCPPCAAYLGASPLHGLGNGIS